MTRSQYQATGTTLYVSRSPGLSLPDSVVGTSRCPSGLVPGMIAGSAYWYRWLLGVADVERVGAR